MIENKIEILLDKCRVLFTEIGFLDCHICELGITPTDRVIEAVLNFPVPRELK